MATAMSSGRTDSHLISISICEHNPERRERERESKVVSLIGNNNKHRIDNPP